MNPNVKGEIGTSARLGADGFGTRPPRAVSAAREHRAMTTARTLTGARPYQPELETKRPPRGQDAPSG